MEENMIGLNSSAGRLHSDMKNIFDLSSLKKIILSCCNLSEIKKKI